MAEKSYVTYREFGRHVAARLQERHSAFPEHRIRKILWWAEDTGRDGFDREMIDDKPMLALTESNIEKFCSIFPAWKEEARRRKKEDFHEPIENRIMPDEQLRQWKNFDPRYAHNFYRR